ncbi:ankyrin repeat domain-containing protein [Rickettsia bellii]|uniref:Putative ankyrin repeat protein RBE_0984 n=1 Tax=Rickettsia bellii (strain RML369-C) TaxID=336407 RepID=Y984_RICBR|nr:ankyrin repeat domain-containing protein [Rickettsia bellii]Q1RHU9.1 RecName: Full=Putative ankyrin repeat protein RBE_0984 [Rickettsia bellii RML369-C]ABE05065.1 Ankyrin repeat [Rickettsia bellii RML369-C]
MFAFFRSSSNEPDGTLYNKLIEAIKSRNSLEVLALIPKMKNEELAKPNIYGNTPLSLALNKKLEAVCEVLVSRMSDKDISIIETYVEHRETYFTLAAIKGFKGVCENLAPRMSNEAINVINARKHTALTLAADKNLPQVCIKLIPIMFDEVINVTENRHKDSALRKAIWNDLDVVCQMLIPVTSKENINYIDVSDRTLLILAAQKGMKVVCKMLISRMIEDNSLDIINHVISKGELKGESALSLAEKQKGFEDICELLQKSHEEYKEQKQKENEKKCEESQPKKIISEDINKLLNELKDGAYNNKNIIEFSISAKIEKLEKNANDLSEIYTNIQDIINHNKNTKAKLLALEKHLNQIIDAQTINTEQQISLEALGDVSVEFSNSRGV